MPVGLVGQDWSGLDSDSFTSSLTGLAKLPRSNRPLKFRMELERKKVRALCRKLCHHTNSVGVEQLLLVDLDILRHHNHFGCEYERSHRTCCVNRTLPKGGVRQ
jgi:hypothetical protein